MDFGHSPVQGLLGLQEGALSACKLLFDLPHGRPVRSHIAHYTAVQLASSIWPRLIAESGRDESAFPVRPLRTCLAASYVPTQDDRRPRLALTSLHDASS